MRETEKTIRIVKMASAIRQAIPSSNARSARERYRYQQLSTALSYLSVLVLIASIVSLGYQPPIERQVTGRTSQTTAMAATNPSVDQILAADLAAGVAQMANLSVATNASNLSISLNAKGELAQSDDNVLSKPQIVQTGEHRGVIEYVAVDGDSVAAVAGRFGVTPQTISWANNLTADGLPAGKTLLVPGIDGVVYTVKSGDTIDSIVQKYKADLQRTVTYNDLEVSGVAPGMRLVLPDGQLPESERPGYVAPSTATSYYSYSSSYSVIYGASSASVGNRYDYGYCTWYAYNRRAELGRPVGSFWGNAATWASYAAASGYRVDHTPEFGAVMQNAGGWGGYGHVAVVEQVYEDGSVRVSEMNYAGWNVISQRTISADQAASYNYIH